MEIIIAGFLTAVLAFMLFITGMVLNKNGRSFNESKRYGYGEVVGYDCGDQSSRYTLLVRIPELHDGKIYNCKSGKINIGNYPKGSVVNIIYAPKSIVGIEVIEVYLSDCPPADSVALGKKFKILSIVMFVISCILMVAGIATTL